MNNLFSVCNLTKQFANSGSAGVFSVLSGINIDILEGSCLVISGANGSGKTVLVRILLGLIEPTSGDVFFRGTSLAKAIPLIRREAGMVFQDADAQILGETLAEDVRFGLKNQKLPKNEREMRVTEALQAVNLEKKRDCPPRLLSGGEKRRLAVAGILSSGCTTVIMDEPFANLDFLSVKSVLEIIASLKKSGKTVIIVTHELEKCLAFADRLIIIHGGLICDDGDPQAVLDRLRPEYGIRDPRQVIKSVQDCRWL